jgi:putative DNA primase/helicase
MTSATDIAREIEGRRYRLMLRRVVIYGKQWCFDKTKLVFDKARLVCRDAANAWNERNAAALASKKTVWAVLALSATDRRIAATLDQWDTDPWLLNTPINVIDLRTGQSQPHRAEDYMTKVAGVAPKFLGCPTPTWQSFLEVSPVVMPSWSDF